MMTVEIVVSRLTFYTDLFSCLILLIVDSELCQNHLYLWCKLPFRDPVHVLVKVSCKLLRI